MKTLVLAVAAVLGMSASAFAATENNDSTAVQTAQEQPAVTVITADQLPAEVQTAFKTDFPGVEPTKVESNAGVSFKIYYPAADGTEASVVYDATGKRIEK